MPFSIPDAVLGFMGAAVPGGITVWATRQKFTEAVLKIVREENEDLRAEVAACRKRDARILVTESCMRLALPELARLDPGNGILAQVNNMLRALPAPENDPGWKELLDQVSEADRRWREKHGGGGK